MEGSFADSPVTVERLANMLGVSARTIRYDLEIVTDVLEQRGFKLMKKSGHGIWLERIEVNKSNSEINIRVYDSTERYDLIIIELLIHTNSFVDNLAQRLMVSRNTLLADLKEVQQILEKRGLKYNSKRGYGIWADGSELAIRDMLIHIFSKGQYNFRDFSYRLGNESGQQQFFYEFVNAMPIQHIADNFLDFAEGNFKGSDASMNRMIIAIAVALKRIEDGHIFPKNELKTSEQQEIKLYSSALSLSEKLSVFEPAFGSQAEIKYLMQELLHSRLSIKQIITEKKQYNSGNHSFESDAVQAMTMARQFIDNVQVWLGDIYSDDDELLYNLAMHLQPAIERARYGIVFTNPLLRQIQEQYGELHSMARKAINKLTDNTNICFSEDEIGYLTIHLGAAVERRRLNWKKQLSVLLVCGNGMGTASLLAITLKNKLPYINIVDMVSLYNLKNTSLQNIDIVISTVNLDIPNKAVMRISPILRDAEIPIIENQIKFLYNKKFHPEKISNANLVESYRLFNLLTPQVISFEDSVNSWEDAVWCAGSLLQKAGAVTENYVKSMVECVKELGPYIVVCPGVAMPHSRCEDGANRVSVSYLKLNKPVVFGEGENSTKVDMIFAFSAIDEKQHLKMIEDLWKLFSNERYLKNLRMCNTKEQVIEYVCKICADSN